MASAHPEGEHGAPGSAGSGASRGRGLLPGAPARTVVALVVGVALLAAGLISTAGRATAGPVATQVSGPGITITIPGSQHPVHLGANLTPLTLAEAFAGNVAFCIQAQVQAATDGATIAGTEEILSPVLAAAIARDQGSSDVTTIAALGYLTRMELEVPGHLAGGDVARAKNLIAAATPQYVKDAAANLWSDAQRNAGPFVGAGGTPATDNKRTGTINGIGVLSDAGVYQAGKPYTVTLDGPAVFEGTSTNMISGVTESGPISLTWIATGNGQVTGDAFYDEIDRVTMTKVVFNPAAGRFEAQAVMTYGFRGPSDPEEITTPGTPFEVVVDFDPRLTSQVASEWVAAGAPAVDTVTAFAAEGQEWPQVDGAYVPLRARGVVHHDPVSPFVESALAPAGTTVVGEPLFLDFAGPGTMSTSATDVVGPDGGRLNFQWSFLRADQPEAIRQYMRSEYSDAFGLAAETTKTPFQVAGETERNDRVVAIGTPLVDTIRAFATGGSSWMIRDDGQPVTSVFTSTSIGPVSQAPVQGTPLTGMPVNGTPEKLSFTAAGEQTTSGTVTGARPGFYTYDTAALRADLAAADRPYIGADWVDETWRETETTVVRWKPTHYSLAREYTLTTESRIFDDITLAGYPEDHGDYEGTPGTSWTPDVDLGTVRLYAVPKAVVNDHEEVPDGTPVIWEGQIPATNGTHTLGYDEVIGYDGINEDTKLVPGMCYVMVYSHEGSDRVEPLASRLNDIRECGCVADNPEVELPVQIVTNAVQDVAPGDQVWDTALIIGAVEDGDTLVVESFLGDVDRDGNALPAVCTEENRIHVSEPVTITQAGLYSSTPFEAPDVKGTRPIHHVEHLVNKGTDRATGECGASYETTLVTEPTPEEPPAPPVPPAPEVTPEPEAAPAPGPALATTGAAITAMVTAGFLLIAAGTGVVLVRRHRALAADVTVQD